jgi:hypothetical protein
VKVGLRLLANGLNSLVNMTTLTCKIPESLDARLEKLARHTKIPKAKIVRKALEQAVRKAPRNSAAFGLVKDLCGSLSGPPDLATNPKYLEDMGA